MDVAESDHTRMLHQEKPDACDTAQDVLSAVGHNSSCSVKSYDTRPASVVPDGHVQVDPNLDGGYGWVIVMASFFVAFVVDGVGSSFGLLFPYILSKFDSSAFVATFAGSTFVAFMIMGSVAAALVKQFGFRLVALSGSILSCLAFVASVFSPNIYVFIATFGFLGGCSCGLVFIPSIIIVNEYFHQKRGIANGIISSGSGVGLLVLGPIINQLLDAYSLDGTILILAAVLLNMCVFSSLYRRPGHSLQREPSLLDDHGKHVYGGLAVESLSSNLSTDNLDLFSVDNEHNTLKVDKHDTSNPHFHADEVVENYCKIYSRECAGVPVSSDDREDGANFYLKYVLHHLKPRACSHLQQHTTGRLHAHWTSDVHLHTSTMQHMLKDGRSYSMFDMPSWCQNKDSGQVVEYILQRHRQFGAGQRAHQPHRGSHSQSLHVGQASSCYLAGSISTLLALHNSFVHALPQSGLKSIASLTSTSMSSKLQNVQQLSADTSDACEQLPAQNRTDVEIVDIGTFLLPQAQRAYSQPNKARQSSECVDRPGYAGVPADDHTQVSEESDSDLPLGYTMAQLLCMPSFHLFCLGAALIQIGYPLAGTFLADYAYQFGLSTSHTAVLMGLLGGLNVCGRLLAGSLVSLKMDPLFLNNLSLLLGGVACLLSPLYSQFWSLCVFASMFGFFLGFFPPLQPLIIVKHFGLETLASAFGFLSTVKGVASILGAPLAGFIYDVTGQYSMSFMFGGAVFVLSSLVHCLMTLSDRCRQGKPPLSGCLGS
ncbi:hypothetical protein BsWGS_09837 [Bradybaena similaris]